MVTSNSVKILKDEAGEEKGEVAHLEVENRVARVRRYDDAQVTEMIARARRIIQVIKDWPAIRARLREANPEDSTPLLINHLQHIFFSK